MTSVLMVGWEYPPHNSGGLGVACDGLTKGLVAGGDQVFFTLPFNYSGSISHLDLRSFPNPVQPDKHVPPIGVYQSVPVETAGQRSGWFSDQRPVELVQQYAEAVLKGTRDWQARADVIHAHDWVGLPAGQALSQQSGKPLVAHVHSTEFDRAGGKAGNNAIHQVELAGLLAAQQIVAVSAYTKHLLIKEYGIAGHKISVIHNGVEPIVPVEPSERQFASGRPVVVFMGRFTTQKGPEYFLELAAQLVAQRPDVICIMAGMGELYQDLLLTNASRQLTSSVLFTGFLRGRQRDRLLARADVFVMPSLAEPFGLVALEAAQHQTPVIVSKGSGVSEVLPSAISLDFWDTALMTSTVLELISNRGHVQQIVAGQAHDITRLTWDSAARKLEKVYQRAMLGNT